MHHFAYRDGVLSAEAVDLVTLAEAVGTPFYCYASATLERHYRVFAGAFADVDALVCYALKANSNQAVIATLARLGAGADVVSEGELMRARAAGVAPEKIMFSGVGKTARARARCRPRHSLRQCRVRSGARTSGGDHGRQGCLPISRSGSIPTSTQRPTPRSRPARRRTSSAFRSAAREVYARAAKLDGGASSASTCISAARSSNSTWRRLALLADFVAVLRADGHAITHLDLGGGLGIPTARTAAARPGRLWAVVKRATQGSAAG
jgi:diaminopimelate decarboxylase